MSALGKDAIPAWPVSPLQIGTAHVGMDVVGGRPTTIVMLPYSRALWAEPMDFQTARSVSRVLLHAVRYFRAAPRAWRFENPDSTIADWDGHDWSFKPSLAELARCCSADLTLSGRSLRVTTEAFHVLRMGWLARCPAQCAIGKVPPPDLCAFFDQAAQRRHPFVPKRTVAQMQVIERTFMLPEPGAELEELLAAEA